MSSRSPGPRAAAAILALSLLLAAGGWAGPCLAADAIAVDVAAVYASNEGSSIDPALKNIRGKLDSMFHYSSYKLLDRKRRRLGVDEKGDFDLPGNRSMRVKLLSVRENKVRLAIRIREGEKKLLGTTLGLSRGGMVLVGGPSHEAGVLIFLISAD